MRVLLVCNNGGQRTIVQAADRDGYDKLLAEVHSKWPELGNHAFGFQYTIGRHSNCIMNSDVDFANMFVLAEALAANCVEIDVCVTAKPSSLGRESPNFDRKRKHPVSPDVTPLLGKQYAVPNVEIQSGPNVFTDELYKMYSQFDIRGINPTEPGCSNGGVSREFYGLNAMPSYDVCPVVKKIPLQTDGWENAITGKGQLFTGGREEFKMELSKYATKIGFHYNFSKNNKDYVYVECKEKDATDCRWLIRGKETLGTGLFHIHVANLNHDCLGQLVRKDHGRIGPKMWGSLIQDVVRAKPHEKGKYVQEYIKVNFGLDIPYFTAYRGMENARDSIYGSFKASYDQLGWWGEAVVRKNPGSIVEIETVECKDLPLSVIDHLQFADEVTEVNEPRTFKRTFIAFDACIKGFEDCRPMLFVDGTHQIGRWTGTILTATGKDGNNGLFPVAMALVRSETLDNWTWFLKKLKGLVKHEKKIWYVSDRNTGLMSAFPKVFDEPTHFFCLFHLHHNLKGYFSGPWSNQHRKDMCGLLSECAYAPNERLFAISMAKFRALGGGVLADRFLQDLPYDKWAFAYSSHIQRFGEMTSNAAESFNGWIKSARSLPVTYMVDTIRADIMRWFVERRADAETWHSKLCEFRKHIWNHYVDVIRTWYVLECPYDNYKVDSRTSVEVNMKARTCSCGQWQIQGFPCAHAVAAIRKGSFKIEDVIEPCFFTDNYKRCYARNINPIPDTEKYECPSYNAPVQILPPPSQNKPGRPKGKRIKSYGEVPKRPKSVCPICGIRSRHDAMTCNLAGK